MMFLMQFVPLGLSYKERLSAVYHYARIKFLDKYPIAKLPTEIVPLSKVLHVKE